MKKKIFWLIIITCLILIILGIKFIPFGSKSYSNKKLSTTLTVPRLSFFKEECCMFSATFKSFRSKNSLQKELDKIIEKYEKKTCNNKTIYYDSANEITIYEYGVKSGFPFNTYYINYDKVNMSNDDCNVITDPTKIEYNYYHADDDQREELSALYQYLNSNGNKYDVYSDCYMCLSIKKGMGYSDSFENMLQSSYISMDDLINFLEYQVENGDATKNYYSNKEIILYKNADFSLLKCDTQNGNKNVYISDQLEYNESYCK